jgi:hypothetical protein
MHYTLTLQKIICGKNQKQQLIKIIRYFFIITNYLRYKKKVACPLVDFLCAIKGPKYSNDNVKSVDFNVFHMFLLMNPFKKIMQNRKTIFLIRHCKL